MIRAVALEMSRQPSRASGTRGRLGNDCSRAATSAKLSPRGDDRSAIERSGPKESDALIGREDHRIEPRYEQIFISEIFSTSFAYLSDFFPRTPESGVFYQAVVVRIKAEDNVRTVLDRSVSCLVEPVTDHFSLVCLSLRID